MNVHHHLAILALLMCLCPPLSGQSATEDSTAFAFPLNLGDEWYYSVTNDIYPGVDWAYRTTVKVELDTTMPNGEHYYQLSSMADSYGHPLDAKIFLRKAGCQVFQYFPEDTIEYLRFDFCAKVGDTISSFSFDPCSGYPTEFQTNTILSDSASSYYLGKYRIMFSFTDHPPSSFSDGFTVADGLGIIHQVDRGLSQWSLIGAKLNGIEYGEIVAVRGGPFEPPAGFSLYQNYPNPFNPSTTVRYSLPRETLVTLTVIDALGRQVAVLANAVQPSGEHEVRLDASTFPTGIYFFQLRADGFSITKKALVLR